VNTCARNSWLLFFTPFANGDMGVDVFFVLSGFLIGYILLKECEAHDGDLDTWGFLRNRFLRLWPALFVIMLVTLAGNLAGHKGVANALTIFVSNLLFIANFTGEITHLWTIAVEF